MKHTHKPGYKHTPLGWIPDDWELELLENISKRGSGHTPDKAFSTYYNGGIKWVSLADSFRLDQGLITETEIEISKEGVKNSSAVLHPTGTVLISRDAGIGKSAVMGRDMAVSQHFITWTCGDLLNNWFLYYWLQYKKEYFERQAVGSTIKTIGLPLFKKLKVPYPPLPEQQKIATILTTWDEAIKKTQQLIAQLKQRNKGLMQQLMSGKKRLKGFSGKWNTEELENVVDYEQPIKYLTTNIIDTVDNKMVPVLTANKSFILGYTHDQTGIYRKLPTVIFDDFTTMSKYVEFPFKVKSSAIKMLATKRGYDLRFFFYSLQLIRTNIAEHKRRWISEFATKSVKFPPLDEQAAIADTLTFAGGELKLYEQQLTTLQQQKKGLMQKLLSGEVRVKLNEK